MGRMDTIDAFGRFAVVVAAVVGVVGGIVIVMRSKRRRQAAIKAAKRLPPPLPGELNDLREARPGITGALFVKLFTPGIIAVLLVVACASAMGVLDIGVFFVSAMVWMAVTVVTVIVLPKARHDMCPSCLTRRNYDRRDVGLRMICRNCGRQWRAGTCPCER